MASSSRAFDKLAARYDELWTNTSAGRLQRESVWRFLKGHFRAGDSMIDMGCGTGEDAIYLEREGIRVSAFDASPAMVRIACDRGVAACVLGLEELDRIDGTFDGALSNFGALNCVPSLKDLRAPLTRLIRPGGTLAVCVIGRFCLWESIHFLLRGELRKAARRWSGQSVSQSLGLRVFYPTARQMRKALAPDFKLVRFAGIGVFIPPSYVKEPSGRILKACAVLEEQLAHLPFLRTLSDHRLLVFARC
ncbi:MAG TPA: methyltransferase domain-containing protein [Bryobacteraceae bacterium]|jgi:ubiquinone/menaquinone biosynthesis C-methylase UbiE|nr:methyltransferase domain-containing protein [Bryobacteraceae bacterium]